MPADGETMGEIFFRGNLVMKGYLKNAQATEEAFAGGWFHTGDLAVMHADGYVKIKDRSKDVIISGGENISSVEVEEVLYRHPAVLAAAVVAKPDAKWGEVAAAFVELRDGCNGHRGRDHRTLPRRDGALQGAQAGDLRRAAEDLDRQDPEVRAARADAFGLGHRLRARVMADDILLKTSGATKKIQGLRRGALPSALRGLLEAGALREHGLHGTRATLGLSDAQF